MHDHQECKSFFGRISDYLDGELNAANYDTIEKHLRQCPPCQVCVATLRQTIALCRELKDSDMPEGAAQRLRTAIDKMMSN